MLNNYLKKMLNLSFCSILGALLTTMLSTPSKASENKDSITIYASGCSFSSYTDWGAHVPLRRKFFYTDSGYKILHTPDTFKNALIDYMKRVEFYSQSTKTDTNGKLITFISQHLIKPSYINIALPTKTNFTDTLSDQWCEHQGRYRDYQSYFFNNEKKLNSWCEKCRNTPSWDSINREELKLLCDVLKDNPSIKGLNFTGHNVGDEGLNLISEALKSNSTLSQLWLSNSLVTDQGVVYLNNALEINSSLILLSLERNCINTASASKLVDAFLKKSNSCNKVLCLSFNGWIEDNFHKYLNTYFSRQSKREYKYKVNVKYEYGAESLVVGDAQQKLSLDVECINSLRKNMEVYSKVKLCRKYESRKKEYDLQFTQAQQNEQVVITTTPIPSIDDMFSDGVSVVMPPLPPLTEAQNKEKALAREESGDVAISSVPLASALPIVIDTPPDVATGLSHVPLVTLSDSPIQQKVGPNSSKKHTTQQKEKGVTLKKQTQSYENPTTSSVSPTIPDAHSILINSRAENAAKAPASRLRTPAERKAAAQKKKGL